MSDVVIIGPGRVGTTLAIALARAGHRIVAAGGGSDASRERFRRHVSGARTAADPTEVAGRGDLLILATPDDALADVVTTLAAADVLREGQRVVHVSGSQGLGVLHRAALAGCRIAACHPAQTVPTIDPDVLVGAPWAVTAPPADRDWARDLVEQVGGDPHDVDDDVRILYHAGLALGANAVGAAVAAARQALLAARIDDPRAFLAPLVAASVDNVLERGAAALTGPVVRGDRGTIAAHLAALDADAPALAAVYRHLCRAILAEARPALDATVAAALDDLLREGDR
jgi:predicted short-subunit dehydrogenase-like oxidoreductase (DUF2520 family)